MAFTGVLGEGSLGEFLLGDSAVASPPPPPPPGDTANLWRPFQPMGRVGGPNTVATVSTPSSARLYSHPPADPRYDLIRLQVAAGQITSQTFPQTNPVPGPWQRLGRGPVAQNWATVQPDPPPAPPDMIVSPAFPSVAVVPGPWNRMGTSRRHPPAGPIAFPSVPPPPGVPPTTSDPFGTSRYEVPFVPRAPKTTDERVRSHLDKLSDIFNSLLRAGYVRATDDGEYEIVGGAVALPRGPTADDDRTVGAAVGMTFVNTLDNSVYVCVVNAVGSAVWVRVSS